MENQWPVLSYEKGKATYETLHMWTQIVGKIKLALLPWVNHCWHITLLITPRGFTTSTIVHQQQSFQIDFDFISHELKISCSSGDEKSFSLHQLSVAAFYKEIFEQLAALGIHVEIKPMPSEVAHPIALDQDFVHATYDPEVIRSFHAALQGIQSVFMQHRSGFQGKASPIHFFWGSFDLALSFFSGNPAPKHPGGVPGLPDWVAEEAYCREVSSCGFWTGNENFPEAAFYCYLYPEPEGYKMAKVEPVEAYYHAEMSEYILPYASVQQAEAPEQKLLAFLKTTFTAGAALAQWDQDLMNTELR